MWKNRTNNQYIPCCWSRKECRLPPNHCKHDTHPHPHTIQSVALQRLHPHKQEFPIQLYHWSETEQYLRRLREIIEQINHNVALLIWKRIWTPSTLHCKHRSTTHHINKSCPFDYAIHALHPHKQEFPTRLYHTKKQSSTQGKWCERIKQIKPRCFFPSDLEKYPDSLQISLQCTKEIKESLTCLCSSYKKNIT